MRSLLSEGRVRYETVEKTSEGLRSRLIEREGPTGLLVTTTAVRLHPENETRMLSLTVLDTPEQTRRVLLALADQTKFDHDLDIWRALQEWLERSDNHVEIPFARSLAARIPPIAVRLRRDFTTVLNLIRAHAILHQANRGKDEMGRTIATLEDYEAVRELVAPLIAEGVDAKVPATVRDTVSVVSGLKRMNNGSITVKAVALRLGLDESTAFRRVQTAIRRGFLVNHEQRERQPAKLDIGERLSAELQILPEVESLSDGTIASKKDEIDTLPPGPDYGYSNGSHFPIHIGLGTITNNGTGMSISIAPFP